MIENSLVPVIHACKALEVGRPAFYQWKQREPSIDNDGVVLNAIQEIAAEFPRNGYRRILHALRRQNKVVNHKKVRRLMKENNLLVRRKKSKPITTQSNHGLQKYPNLVKDLVLTGINQAWVADITYIWLQ